MSFRVTQQQTSTAALANLQASLSKLSKTQSRLSSGQQITRPSDDPTGTVSALELRAQKSRADQYGRAAEDGLAVLGTADAALSSGLDQLQRVRSLTVQAMNATATPAARTAAANEIDQIKGSLLSLANTRYLDRPVFAGTADQAFDSTGAYVGDTGAVQRQVADGTRVNVALPGSQVFGSIFATLDQLSSDLRSNPTNLGSDLDAISGGITTVTAASSQIGALTNRVTVAQSAATAQSDATSNQLTNIQNVDLSKTIMDLQVQQVAYQAALGATAKVLQPSLLDFLK